VGLTVSAAVLLVVSYVVHGAPAAIIGIFVWLPVRGAVVRLPAHPPLGQPTGIARPAT
jgi:hypothetical protein